MLQSNIQNVNNSTVTGQRRTHFVVEGAVHAVLFRTKDIRLVGRISKTIGKIESLINTKWEAMGCDLGLAALECSSWEEEDLVESQEASAARQRVSREMWLSQLQTSNRRDSYYKFLENCPQARIITND
jgi:hypothetical protein